MTKMNLNKVAVAVGAAVATGAANAAVDVTPITGAGTDVATVGAAVFALIVGIKAFKWVRRAL